MRVGDFELVALSDGTFRLDGGQMFGVVPKVLWETQAPADDKNRVELAIRPLLVRTGRHNVLIDAGLGDKMTAKERDTYAVDRRDPLKDTLAAAGLTVEDIDLVIATHLHFDHVGGCTTLVGGVPMPTFPRARHIVRRGEWEAATHPNARTRANYLPENFLPLEAAGLIDFVDEDTEVLPGVWVKRTGGHTRDHQLVEIRSGRQTAVFVADLIPTAAHLRGPWIMGFDLYPMDTLAYKDRFVAEAIEGEYVIFFEHDSHVVAGVVRRDGSHVRLDPVVP